MKGWDGMGCDREKEAAKANRGQECWSCCWYQMAQPEPTPVVDVGKNPNGGGYGRRE